MFTWIFTHETFLWWAASFSTLTFLGSLIAVPLLIVRIPADYFLHQRSLLHLEKTAHPLLRGFVLVLKNTLGILLLLAGMTMLLLPGQGIITILMGLFFMDFPGKFALERRIVRIHSVHHAIDWMRRKANKPPLLLPEC